MTVHTSNLTAMVVHDFICSTWEAKRWISDFKGSLVYKVSPGHLRLHRNAISKYMRKENSEFKTNLKNRELSRPASVIPWDLLHVILKAHPFFSWEVSLNSQLWSENRHHQVARWGFLFLQLVLPSCQWHPFLKNARSSCFTSYPPWLPSLFSWPL